MTDAELKKAVDAIAKRYSDLNIRYIRQIAEQIKAIGELNPKSLNQIAEMLRMNANLSEIVMELQRLTELTKQDVRTIMQLITEDEVMDARYLPYYAEQSGLPESEITPALAKQYAGAEAQERLRRMTLAMVAQTDDRLDNLSNTTALAEPYRQAVDRAVLAVSENVTSYTEAMRDTVRELGHAGMQVQYESGWHRRLDTAVRQNILDATGQLAQTAAITVGEALNYNAFEISAHAMSAPDHEPVQGHVFLTDEFYKLQQNQPSQDADGQQFDAIRRPIKEWNCGHFAFPFDTRFSKRKYTPEQLQKFIDDNKAGCVIGQKRYTLYEASQIMRRIECEIRREKDTAVAAQAAGDDQLRVDCQLRINHLSGLYKQVTDASGLTPRRERMTVEGFRRAKVPENAEKVLTSGEKNGMMKSEKMALPKNEEKIKWLPKGKEISAETRRELTEYAAERGMVLKGLRRSDVDPELIKEMIDTAEEMLRKYPELNSNPNLPFTLKVVNGMDANDFAMTTRYQDINVVQLNANAFRDKNKLEEEYDKLVKERWFAHGTSYRSIIVHEIGHMYQRRRQLSDEDIVNIAMRVSGISDKKALFRYIESDLSRYASRYKEGTEILSEVFSSFYSGNSQSALASGMMSQREMR